MRNISLKPSKNDWWRVTINQEVWMVYNSVCFYLLYTAVTEDPQKNTGKYNLYS